MLALPVCKSWRHQASYSKRNLFCPHEVFQVTKDAPQTILEVTSIAISTWASQTELYQIFRFGQFVFTRHSRLRAKPRAGIIALKVPGSVGTRGYVCIEKRLKIRSPTRVLPDRHRRTCQNYHVHVPNTNFDSIQWNSLESLSQGPKGRKYNQGNQRATNEWLYQVSTITTLACWCGNWFLFRTILVDWTFVGWERCDKMWYFTIDCFVQLSTNKFLQNLAQTQILQK